MGRQDSVTLNCLNCPAVLRVTSDLDRITCRVCENAYVVDRSGSFAALKPVLEWLEQVRPDAAQAASAPEIRRLTDEIRSLETELALKVRRRRSSEIGVGCGLILLFKLGIAFSFGVFMMDGQDKLISLVLGMTFLACALHILGKFSIFGFSNKKYLPDKATEDVLEKKIEQKRRQLVKLRGDGP